MGYDLADDGRLVFVAQTYFPAIDGTAVLIQNLAEQFAADGDEVHVITSDALPLTAYRRTAVRREAPLDPGHWKAPSPYATSTPGLAAAR